MKNFPIKKLSIEYVIELIKQFAFVAVFFMLPRLLFVKYMPNGAEQFATNQAFVYWGMILCVLCGSIINSEIFKRTRETSEMIQEEFSAKNYFRQRILKKAALEMLSFWPAFTVFGMNFFRAFYLTLLIVLGRFLGYTLNILMFRAFRKSIPMIKGADVPIMVLSLLFAYYIPYSLGYIPNAYAILFNDVWFAIIMLVSAIFIYFVWNYHGYESIYRKLSRSATEIEHEEDVKSLDEEIDSLISSEDYTMSGYQKLNKSFYIESIKDIVNQIIIRLIVIVVAMIVAIIAAANGNNKMVFTVIQYSMPMIPFIIAVMNISGGICKNMFYQCDKTLLNQAQFRRRNDILINFIIRLRYNLIFDIIPALVLAVAYWVAGKVAKGYAEPDTVAAVCVGIIFTSVLFTVLRLAIYYISQPYSVSEKKGNVIHFIINIVILAACIAFVYMEAQAINFTMVTGLVLGGVAAISTLVIDFFGKNTFKLKK